MKFLADENFDGRIVRGLLRRRPEVDLVRLVDVGLRGASDPAVLEWSAQEGRIILTHDVSTMVGFAYQRVDEGLAMPGLIEVPPGLASGSVIDDLLLIIDTSFPGEWQNQVIYLPI